MLRANIQIEITMKEEQDLNKVAAIDEKTEIKEKIFAKQARLEEKRRIKEEKNRVTQ